MQSTSLATYQIKNQSPILSKKVKDLERSEVGKIIAYICAVTGITQSPTDYAVKVTVDFVQNNFQNYGILEFKTAFDMYVGGKLPKRDNESHYNTISAAFIGSVMNKYNTHRTKEMRKLEEQQAQQDKPKATYTAQTYENAFNYAVGYVQVNQQLPTAGQYVHVYEHFKAAGLGWYRLEVKERIEAKKEFQEKIRKQLTGEARENSTRANLSKRALNNKDLFKTECKIRYAKEQLTLLINSNDKTN